MIEDLLVPFVAVGLAELGDKTQLSILLLSSKTQKHLHLLIGVTLAFLIADGAAIMLGSYATDMLPVSWLKIASGIIFTTFGLLTLIRREKTVESKLYSQNSFIAGFVLIFISELGDKTQIASALIATQYNTLLVLAGVMTALTLLSLMAIYLGKLIANKIDKNLISKIAGVAFIAIGMVMLASSIVT